MNTVVHSTPNTSARVKNLILSARSAHTAYTMHGWDAYAYGADSGGQVHEEPLEVGVAVGVRGYRHAGGRGRGQRVHGYDVLTNLDI